MNNLKNISKSPSLAEKAYNIIRDAIISNELKPEQILTEEYLAQKLQISRTPVRTALHRLLYEEIVYSSGKNIIVSGISQKDITDMFVVRRLLEPAAVKIMIENGVSQQNKKAFVNLIELQDIAAEKSNYEEFLRAEMEFHSLISTLSNNKYLQEYIDKITLIEHRFIILSGVLPTYINIVLDEHKDILNNILNDDAQGAYNSLLTHINNIYDRTMAYNSDKY